jgi:hypothetical protein
METAYLIDRSRRAARGMVVLGALIERVSSQTRWHEI